MRGLGRDPVLTREPGGAPGRRISAACWWRATPPAGRPRPRSCCSPPHGAITWNARSAPRWRAGQDVITDRFADSTRVYQGATRGDLRGLVDTIHDAAIGVEPDLTLILDMDPATRLTGALPAAPARTGSRSSAWSSSKSSARGSLPWSPRKPDRCV
jgi:dTMP kinase